MENPNFKIGMTALEVLIEMVRTNHQINGLSFYVFKPQRRPLSRELWPSLSVAELLYHDPSKVSYRLSRKEITLAAFTEVAERLYNFQIPQILCVLSTARFGPRGVLHIPMMDFRCEHTPENLEKVIDFLSQIDQKGVILFSGNSYHFYGQRLINKREWLKFLGKCLLFSSHTDPRYIGHQLLDGLAILRISSKGGEEIPRVVSILE